MNIIFHNQQFSYISIKLNDSLIDIQIPSVKMIKMVSKYDINRKLPENLDFLKLYKSNNKFNKVITNFNNSKQCHLSIPKSSQSLILCMLAVKTGNSLYFYPAAQMFISYHNICLSTLFLSYFNNYLLSFNVTSMK